MPAAWVEKAKGQWARVGLPAKRHTARNSLSARKAKQMERVYCKRSVVIYPIRTTNPVKIATTFVIVFSHHPIFSRRSRSATLMAAFSCSSPSSASCIPQIVVAHFSDDIETPKFSAFRSNFASSNLLISKSMRLTSNCWSTIQSSAAGWPSSRYIRRYSAVTFSLPRLSSRSFFRSRISRRSLKGINLSNMLITNSRATVIK